MASKHLAIYIRHINEHIQVPIGTGVLHLHSSFSVHNDKQLEIDALN